MAKTKITGARVAALCTSVPSARFDNLKDTKDFSREEVRKVTAMAGVSARRVADENTCSSDLCEIAANRALEMADWDRESVDALILVTQTPDYFLPSTSCVLHEKLGLSTDCATFDVGLGCSGYPYGLWLAGMMLQGGGIRRALLLHGDTLTRYSHKSDRSVSLLFGDAGSATAIEGNGCDTSDAWSFLLHTDGSRYRDLLIEAGGFRDRFCTDRRRHYVSMDGAAIFNFTIKRVPDLVRDTLSFTELSAKDIDYFIFHQANRFIVKHLVKKLEIPEEKVPLVLEEYGNTGGVSLPLTITQGKLDRTGKEKLNLMLLGYGTGMSWASALIKIEAGVPIDHIELPDREGASSA